MTINGSVRPPEDNMSERETMEHFADGGKRAISAGKELAKATGNPEWINSVETLEALVLGGQQLANMRAMSRFETMMACSLKSNPKGLLN